LGISRQKVVKKCHKRKNAENVLSLTHGDDGEYLHEVVLHDVPDDAALVEVAAPALGPEVLLERDCDRGDVVPVEGGRHELVAEPDRATTNEWHR
jgi:hypothetical protein